MAAWIARGAQIKLRWRADVNQPSMQSARPLLTEGRLESTGFVVAGPPTFHVFTDSREYSADAVARTHGDLRTVWIPMKAAGDSD